MSYITLSLSLAAFLSKYIDAGNADWIYNGLLRQHIIACSIFTRRGNRRVLQLGETDRCNSANFHLLSQNSWVVSILLAKFAFSTLNS